MKVWALCILLQALPIMLGAAISIAPLACYPQYSSAAAMNSAATASGGASPFATWKGAYDYAIANNINTINFVQGTYLPGVVGAVSDWGDANGGYDLTINGMTVNGNGAVIDNSANGSSQLCFATIAASNVTVNGLTFVGFTGNSAGAMLVNTNLTGWTISNCNFDHCDWAGDGLVVNMGNTGVGTITGCNFYNHVQTTGSALTVNGTGTASAFSDLNITNTVFSCNLRIVAGGAVRILANANVDFLGCTFDGNQTNSASGGAISIQANSVVTFTNTIFTCNTANVNVLDDGGAMDIISGADVTITNCNFKGNIAKRHGGAIYTSGTSANIVDLHITNTIFDGNSTNTSLSKGGAIYLNDANTTIDQSYFKSNTVNATNGQGGGLFVVKGNNVATVSMSNSTFTTNAASGSCTGIDVFTEVNISGTNNQLQYLADGNNLSNQSGSLQFTNGDDCDALSNWTATAGTVSVNSGNLDVKGSGATLAYASQVESGTGKLYWTFTCWTASTMSGLATGSRAMGFVLGGTNANFTTGNGFAIVKGRDGTAKIEFITYTGGLNNTASHVVKKLFSTPGQEEGYLTFKVMYDPVGQDWTFYWTQGASTAGPAANESDPRGYNWCTSATSTLTTVLDVPFTLSTNPNVGPFWNASSTSNLATFNNYYFRAGDETSGTGWSGSYAAATCNTCLSTVNPPNDCSAVLPVSFAFFDVEKEASAVKLKWVTETELNNRFFEIQRSSDNRGWNTIAAVDSKYGTSLNQVEYEAIDPNPARGINYYRIKQVDRDGQTSFSSIRAVSFDHTPIVAVSPNPASDVMHLESTEEIKSWQVVDMTGKAITSITELSPNKTQEIGLGNIPAGMYILRLTHENGAISNQMVQIR